MKTKILFLAPLALLVTCTLCDEQEAKTDTKRPTYVVTEFEQDSKIAFFETFQGRDLSSEGWIFSKAESYTKQNPQIDSEGAAFDGDKSLILKSKHVRYGLSKKLESPLDMTEDEIVFQFESRFMTGLTCSGGYIKFVSVPESEKPETFDEATPYVLMFGPDKCGGSEKTHAIFRSKNPVSGEYEEKHMKGISKFDSDKATHVFSLIINNIDQTVKVLIDQSEKALKNVKDSDSFAPSFLPPEEIDDPEDKKPEDWVDESMIPDPDAVKPENWVEEEYIEDPDSSKPEDWNDDEDGEWEPAQIKNPEYIGLWEAPLIENPAYKGSWSPKNIPNPNFFVEDFPLKKLDKVTHVFIEVLANDADISFDNILITSNIKVAGKLAEEQALVKQRHERDMIAIAEAEKRKADRDKNLQENFGFVSLMEYISEEAKEFYEANPTAVFVGVLTVFTTIFYFFLWKPKDRNKDSPSTNDSPLENNEEKKSEDEGSDIKEEDQSELKEEDSTNKVKTNVRRRPRKAD